METTADLRAWRARRAWTQEQAADALGFSRRGYQTAEWGDRFLTSRMIRAVRDFETVERLRPFDFEAKEGEGDE